MDEAIRLERERWADVCRRRAELWRKTAAKSPYAAAREEARARANEAAYLADLIASGNDRPLTSDVAADDADA
jgi:hypothetical protein